jgi:hypothetical protein
MGSIERASLCLPTPATTPIGFINPTGVVAGGTGRHRVKQQSFLYVLPLSVSELKGLIHLTDEAFPLPDTCTTLDLATGRT